MPRIRVGVVHSLPHARPMRPVRPFKTPPNSHTMPNRRNIDSPNTTSGKPRLRAQKSGPKPPPVVKPEPRSMAIDFPPANRAKKTDKPMIYSPRYKRQA